ncbi:hypothetical protein [Rhizorhabdus wittichii]|uniref:hypothetical protein n=1 Tax=Rhizorhabdus wittichii TaxID=160791 RepID=UPI00030E22BB|nr:hypothetical protein [Rhizorhabdus wittichii]
MASDEISAKITKIIESTPEWLRHDLTSKEVLTRARAEETLSSMIAAALNPLKD